ncbi:hypothetical protein ACFL6Y_04125 [Elusimicrobiota bacterium]
MGVGIFMAWYAHNKIMGMGEAILHIKPGFEFRLMREIMNENKTMLTTFKWGFALTWIYSTADAYIWGKREKEETKKPEGSNETCNSCKDAGNRQTL